MTADDNAPEAWYMDSRDDIDQREPHRLEPNEPVCGATLRRLGVTYWKLDADKHEDDPELEKIRADRGYNYQDIITVSKDKLPGYEEKIKIFFEEHIHEDEEIRYVLDGRCVLLISSFSAHTNGGGVQACTCTRTGYSSMRNVHFDAWNQTQRCAIHIFSER